MPLLVLEEMSVPQGIQYMCELRGIRMITFKRRAIALL